MSEKKSLLEYFKEILPEALVDCDGCEAKREAAQCVVRGANIYCSEKCADQATAILLKPGPKGVKLGAYDI